MSNKITAWERQKGESEKAYAAFKAYCEMGEERSILGVSKQLAKSRQLIDNWKSRWNWPERVREYDNELERQAMAKAVKEKKAMFERHIKSSMLLQKKALEALEMIPPENLTPKDITNMIELSTRIERLSRGEATEKTEGKTELSGTNGQPVNVCLYVPEKEPIE